MHPLGSIGRYRNTSPLLERSAGPDHSQGQKGLQLAGDHRRHPAVRMEGHVSAGVALEQGAAREDPRQVGREAVLENFHHEAHEGHEVGILSDNNSEK